MTLILGPHQAFFGTVVALDHFEDLAREHRKRFPSTLDIEEQGLRFIENGFPERDVEAFVKAVCGWGNYAGIAGRVLKRNALHTISLALKDCLPYLDANPVELGAALTKINALNGLGSASFASKHLRFLRPEVAPVLDSLLRTALPYRFNALGYADFGRDCAVVAETLTLRRVPNAFQRKDGKWFVADVEAALYANVYVDPTPPA